MTRLERKANFDTGGVVDDFARSEWFRLDFEPCVKEHTLMIFRTMINWKKASAAGGRPAPVSKRGEGW